MTRGSLFEKHKPLARRQARDFYLPGSDRQDVEQEAYIGLWIATGAWDRARSSFAPFATLVIRRRLITLVKMALARKHQPLNDSVRYTVGLDGEKEVLLVDALPLGKDPLQVVLDRERWERFCEAAEGLTLLERQCLEELVAGIPQDKQADNAVNRARVKLRRAL